MKKIDKIRAIKFEAATQLHEGTVYGYVHYDISKLRFVKYEDLRELLFEKTLQLYPFAIVDRVVHYEDPYCKTASMPVFLPLSPSLRLASEPEGEVNDER